MPDLPEIEIDNDRDPADEDCVPPESFYSADEPVGEEEGSS